GCGARDAWLGRARARSRGRASHDPLAHRVRAPGAPRSPERQDRAAGTRAVERVLAGRARATDGGGAATRAAGSEHLMPAAATDDGYKWVALSNTTMAVFMSALDGSIVIIALPAIFRGINLDPLAAGNISYLLWMIMGYRLVQAVLVVTV